MILGNKISWHPQKSSKPILKEVCFQLREGRITTFMGHSGAGKTTLLKCLANLYSQYEGIMMCEGRDLKSFDAMERASTIGFVFQQFHLFPHFTVLKNCTYALEKVLGLPSIQAEERAIEILEILGMQTFVYAFPNELSGGQQQRVAIARALVLQPKILLLDEPTSALDPESKKSLEALLLDLKAKGFTLALSSHDMPFIRKMMDYVYFMNNGEIIEEWDQQKEQVIHTQNIQQFLSHA